MIINDLMGGLGNQLFQISAGFAHAKNIKTDYAINYKIGSIYNGQGHPHMRYKDNLYKNIPETNNNYFSIYKEPKYSFTQIPKLDNLCLLGYFQSKKYFLGYEEEVKSLFEFPNPLIKKVMNKFDKIKKKKVGIHFRLGDYRLENTKEVFYNIDYSLYLKETTKYFGNEYEFLIFSDDVNWVNNNINLQNTSYEILKPSLSPAKDMALMSLCNHNIIANSTFSWWAAWLNSSVNKIVITPQKWLKKDPQPIGLKIPEWISF